jgi:hypothetical protein
MTADAVILRFTEVALVRAANFNRPRQCPAPPFSTGLNTYFMGLLRLEQAAMAGRLPDVPKRSTEWLVAYSPTEETTGYRMLAMAELREAITRAGDIRLDEPLLAADQSIDEPIIAPTVGDLLEALRADNFVGRAHHTLFLWPLAARARRALAKLKNNLYRIWNRMVPNKLRQIAWINPVLYRTGVRAMPLARLRE